MKLKELIELTNKAKAISLETGRDFKEVFAGMKAEIKEVKTPKFNLSKGQAMTEKEIVKSNFNRNYQPKNIEDMHAYNRANAIKNMKS